MQNKQPFSKDAIFEIATFCNPKQVFYNCARVNKLWYAAVQQDAYFYFALSRLNFFGDDLHSGIEFVARRKGDYFLYRTIQNWTCKQVFVATMQRIVLKQQQLLLAQQTLQEFKKENPHVKPLPRYEFVTLIYQGWNNKLDQQVRTEEHTCNNHVTNLQCILIRKCTH